MLIIIGLIILLLVFLYSACVISSKYSRLEEIINREKISKLR
mgnify:CR=1 FL=1